MMKPSPQDRTTGERHEATEAIGRKVGELANEPNLKAGGETEENTGSFKTSPERSRRRLVNKTINIEQGSEKGYETMTQTRFEETSEQIADTMHKASRAASSAVEAIEDGAGAVRRAVKNSGYATAELYGDAKRRVQQNPIETVVATFAAGIAAGAAISWMMKRKPGCNCGCTKEMAE